MVLDLPFEATPLLLATIVAVAFAAGFIKGAIGFGMPMVLVSGLGSFLSAEMALAGLIIPTLVSNVMQAFRNGFRPFAQTVWRFRRYIAIVLVCMAFSAQLVVLLPQWAVFTLLGAPVSLFAAAQLLGWQLRIADEARARVETGVAVVAGFFGGVSGIWGPPTVSYLLAIGVEKTEQMRAQGAVYGLGAVVLVFAHLKSGVLNGATIPFSAALLLPAIAGMLLGFRLQDRLDQARFLRLTQVVLVIAGLNLVRRGLLG